MKTAVEWLWKVLLDNGFQELENVEGFYYHAKEMEKQQIIEAHGDEQSHLQDDGSWRTVTAEQYYNETFKSKKDEN